MGDREALMKAVRDDPEDDTVRLVFADFLDEYGSEEDRAWAEFIRLQIDSAKTNNRLSRKREKELFPAVVQAAYPDPKVSGVTSMRIFGTAEFRPAFSWNLIVDFERGFAHRVSGDLPILVKNVEKLFSHPLREFAVRREPHATTSVRLNAERSWDWRFSSQFCEWENYYIPNELFNTMVSLKRHAYQSDATLWIEFSSKKVAEQTLQDTIVAYGRSAYEANNKGE